MSDDLIRYDILTQEALRNVVRKVIEEVAVTGLPGDHHFYITFDTTHHGVRLSKRMRERYPESMTIVIQHTFWDLEVNDNEFELDLTFNDIRERLKVPFAAIQAFFDPSVKFGLQFEPDPADIASTVEKREETVTRLQPADRDKNGQTEPEAPTDPNPEDDDKAADGEVVSLDAFRKKK